MCHSPFCECAIHLFGDSETDRLMCPVRATTLYIQRTAGLVATDGPGRLFRHFHTGIRFRKSHISRWLVDTIITDYDHSDIESLKLEGVSGHQVRGMAASWAYFKDTPLTDIRSAVGWKSASVFTQHYLQDVAADDALRARDLTMVAAGHALRG